MCIRDRCAGLGDAVGDGDGVEGSVDGGAIDGLDVGPGVSVGPEVVPTQPAVTMRMMAASSTAPERRSRGTRPRVTMSTYPATGAAQRGDMGIRSPARRESRDRCDVV